MSFFKEKRKFNYVVILGLVIILVLTYLLIKNFVL